jgi:antitoxin VapB
MYQGAAMRQTAKIFKTGRSQAVRIPAEFRFDGKEVFIRRDEKTGDIILSRRPTWKEIFAMLDSIDVPEEFLSPQQRNQRPPRERNLF